MNNTQATRAAEIIVDWAAAQVVISWWRISGCVVLRSGQQTCGRSEGRARDCRGPTRQQAGAAVPSLARWPWCTHDLQPRKTRSINSGTLLDDYSREHYIPARKASNSWARSCFHLGILLGSSGAADLDGFFAFCRCSCFSSRAASSVKRLTSIGFRFLMKTFSQIFIWRAKAVIEWINSSKEIQVSPTTWL